jgi:hypothetical protein
VYHPLPELGFTPGGGAFGTPGAVFAIYYDNVRDRAFERAANTFLSQASRWFPNAVPLKYGATSVAELLEAWDRIAGEVNGAASTIHCGALFTHASKGGPFPGGGEGGIEMAGVDRITLTCPTDITVENAQIGRMTQLPWAPKAFLLLCGCNTGLAPAGHSPVARSFALRQGVRTIGQMGYAYFSMRWPYYRTITPDVGEICLWAFARGRNRFPLVATDLRIEGRVFR